MKDEELQALLAERDRVGRELEKARGELQVVQDEAVRLRIERARTQGMIDGLKQSMEIIVESMK
jgi:predicted nuclease with TOPRIM domain